MFIADKHLNLLVYKLHKGHCYIHFSHTLEYTCSYVNMYIYTIIPSIMESLQYISIIPVPIIEV